MSVLVIDASVAIKWVLDEIHSEDARRILEKNTVFHAPELLAAECGNILWKRCKRKEMTPSQALKVLEGLMGFPFIMHSHKDLSLPALEITTHCGITQYDALYAATAVAVSGVLITADRKFYNAMAATGIRGSVMWVEDVR